MYLPFLLMMKLRSLLLFATSAVLLELLPASRAPAQFVQASRPTYPISASEVYALVNPAVVTVYAGEEIGSGSIVSPDGLVITNNHVARGSGSGRVEVQTATGQTYDGQIIGIDRRNDLALIKLQADRSLPAIRLATSTGIQIGAPVYAIGSPYGRPGVMTTGALGEVRPNGDLRSRVRLEPGNSGGPLLNAFGEMIGINKAVLETESGQNTGISFATNVAVARNFIEQYRPGHLTPTPQMSQPTVAQQSPTVLPIAPQPCILSIR